MPIHLFTYSVMLRCVSASKILPDSFLSKVCYEGVRELLFAFIRSTTPYIMTSCLFDFILESLEEQEHFILLPHREYLGVPREVVDERGVVSASAESTYLGRSPYI